MSHRSEALPKRGYSRMRGDFFAPGEMSPWATWRVELHLPGAQPADRTRAGVAGLQRAEHHC